MFNLNYEHTITLYNLSRIKILVWCIGKVTVSHARFDPRRVQIFNFSLRLELEGGMEQNFNHYFGLQNTSEFNPEYLQSAFVVKAYEILITIVRGMGMISHVAPFVLFDKS